MMIKNVLQFCLISLVFISKAMATETITAVNLGDVVSEFLSEITGLYKNEERSKNYIDTMIGKKIDDLIKQQEVITAQIKVQNSDLKNCIELNKVKFPELTERTKNIEQKIYSLRSKLDLPPSSDLKPICN